MKKCTCQEFFREWSNTIGYEMGSTPVRFYTTVKTYHVEPFKHTLTNDKVVDMATLFLFREFSGGRISWATSKLNPLTRNLASNELKLETILNFFLIVLCFPSCPPHQSLPQINLALGLKFLTDQCISSP